MNGPVRLTAVIALAAALAVAPAPLAGASAAHGGDSAKEASSDRQMVASNVVTPVVRNGKLVNYLFVTVQVDFTPQANAIKLRDRAHFLRDALLKASHRTMLADPAKDTEINKPVATAAFWSAAKQALGAENIRAVSVTGVDSLRRR